MKVILVVFASLILLATVLGTRRLINPGFMPVLQPKRGKRSRRTTAVVAATLLMMGLLLKANPALAFKPDEQGHLGITSEAIRGNRILPPTWRVVNGVRYYFSANAITEIRNANAATDNLIFGGAGFWVSENHFDNEGFFDSSTRLLRLKNTIVINLRSSSPNGVAARNDLGGALHTIQDYYAHTNWVELGARVIDPRLGKSTFPNPSPSVQTSPLNDSGTLLPGLTQLTSGYFTFPFLCSAPPGKTRHGAPGCSTGLNKDDPTGSSYSQARHLAVWASRDFIEQILNYPGVAGNARAIRALMGR